jgi:basic membrane lipoprotein Med (substrate-binding protein (PBP1-ABC) superfamily)
MILKPYELILIAIIVIVIIIILALLLLLCRKKLKNINQTKLMNQIISSVENKENLRVTTTSNIGSKRGTFKKDLKSSISSWTRFKKNANEDEQASFDSFVNDAILDSKNSSRVT